MRKTLLAMVLAVGLAAEPVRAQEPVETVVVPDAPTRGITEIFPYQEVGTPSEVCSIVVIVTAVWTAAASDFLNA